MAFSFINLRNDQKQRKQQDSSNNWDNVINKKVNQYRNQNMYEKVLGLPPEAAKALSGYEFKDVLSLLESFGQREGGIESLMGGLSPQNPQQQMMQSLQQPQQPQFVNEPTAESLQQIQQQLMQPQGMLNLNQDRVQPQFQQRQVAPEFQMQQQADQMDQPRKGRMTPAQILGQPTKAAQRAQRKLDIEERKFLNQEESENRKYLRDSYKDHEKYINEAYDKAKEASRLVDVVSRMEELEQEGLGGQAYNEFLKKANIDTAALRNGADEEFIKLRQAFIPGVGKIFGGKVSNFELQEWMKSVPDLSNTPEGRKRLTADIKKINKAKMEEAEIIGDLVEKYEKEEKPLPKSFRRIVDQKMKKVNEDLAKQFKKDIKRKVPEASSKLATGAAGIAGSALNTIGKVAGPATIGAGIGMIGGPLGSLGGAAAGGLGSVLYQLSQNKK